MAQTNIAFRRKEHSDLLRTGMKHYPGIIQARLYRLRHIAEEMNRSAVWTSDHDQAGVDKLEADRELMIQSLRSG